MKELDALIVEEPVLPDKEPALPDLPDPEMPDVPETEPSQPVEDMLPDVPSHLPQVDRQ